ncbi:hypothetical protein FRC09_013544 [Ceratobasidium sp. 395]|nr:hypothetical protein FRC09_013544 [Ceratobasidium sp. 395]
MRYLFVLGLPAMALAISSRAQDPCAQIARQSWMKPSEANACLSYFPFNATLRDNIVDVVSKTFSQFHASTSYHLNMPTPFTDDTVDILGELKRIVGTKYSSDYEVHKDISKQTKRLGDGHAEYLNYCYDSSFETYLPFPIAVLADPNALEVQNIHIVPEASEVCAANFRNGAIDKWQSALGRNLSDFDGARVVSINGQDPWSYIDKLAAQSGGYQARTTRQNGFFASYFARTYRMGDFAKLSLPPESDTVALTLIRNGTTARETYNVPYLSKAGSEASGFSDAKTFWSWNCLPSDTTNGSPYYKLSASKPKMNPRAAPDPYSRPARFQSDPIRPQVEEGVMLEVSSLIANGPENIVLPQRSSPSGSLSSARNMRWYMLDDRETAVLQLSSFSGSLRGLQSKVLDGLTKVKAKGATKLLIDLTNNGGGLVCLASWLHRVLAGPQPGIDIQTGLDGSVRAQELPQKIIARIVANNTRVDPNKRLFYNPLTRNGINGKPFAANYNWLNPPTDVQVNGVLDKFSQRLGDPCVPLRSGAPPTKPFEFENIAIMTNGRCGSACSLFSITMATKYNVKTVVVGGKPGTAQQYCGLVGGQASNSVTMDSEVKSLGLKNDPLAPPDFLTNSYQGVTWKLGWSLRDPNVFEEFQTHPAQFTFPLLPSTVNNPMALWSDVSKRLWSNKDVAHTATSTASLPSA